jgi:hypothetical protein
MVCELYLNKAVGENNQGCECSSVVKCLPSMHKALDLIPSTANISNNNDDDDDDQFGTRKKNLTSINTGL